MTVSELIKELKRLEKRGHGEDVVILAKDEEGNGFAELYNYEPTIYDPVERELSQDGGVAALVFWP